MTTEASTTDEDEAGRAASEIQALLASGDWHRASDLASRAIGRGLRHPVFFMVRAQKAEETGQLRFALEDYQRAAAVTPDDVRVHEAVALCATKLGDHARAVVAYDAAIPLAPGRADLHFRRGLALANIGKHDAAQKAHESALEIDPDYVDSLAALAHIVARRGDAVKARDLASRALARNPRQTMASVALVHADIAERRHADAETKLRELLAGDRLPPTYRPSVSIMLADALDAQKKYTEAFAAYARANDELRRMHAAEHRGKSAAEGARNLTIYFENERAERWKAPDDDGEIEGAFDTHVFLMGFMRSGTTLLEQVLASSPDIVALEEKGLLTQAGEQYLTSVRALDDFSRLGCDELMKLRRSYWRQVREYLPGANAKVFVDKQPLAITRLPLIVRMFPRARIIFAIRDPRDVVFSCFRRNLRMNATQYEFLDIETCARMYSLTMRLGEVCREKFDLSLLEHRYEAMVEDFEGRIRAVCDFIGVEWTEAMRNFDQQTSVADLRSPSALQVRRPLYGEGVGQWRRYAKELAPILPILEPWVEKFGYPRD